MGFVFQRYEAFQRGLSMTEEGTHKVEAIETVQHMG